MLKKLTILSTVLLLIILSIGVVYADSSNDITLRVDGVVVTTDVPPVIEKGRTLVPYRALLEALGGEVTWDDEPKIAVATLGSYRVQMTIDSTAGFVNGIQKTLEVPARIINGRTLIPVRFVTENLQCGVSWDEETHTIDITSPSVTDTTEIIAVTVTETDNSWRVVATGNQLIAGTRTFAYEEPERFGIDIENASFPIGNGSIESDNPLFQSVRYSQFDDTTVRVVVDLSTRVAGEVSLSEDRTEVFIDFPKDGNGRGDTEMDISMLPVLNWMASGKLVAIDAGHGGKDSGALGYCNGNEIMEKDINLAVATRLYELLNAASVNVKLLRTSDVYMTLYSRPEAANLLCADLFVSIHNNSSDSSAPKGTEVHYYNKTGDADYGITSEAFATFLQTEMAQKTGLSNRGIQESPKLAILNKSLMPAVIIEGGFLSNASDLSHMVTDAFVEEYATAAATGIINALNATVEE